jgi:hypothetical protein
MNPAAEEGDVAVNVALADVRDPAVEDEDGVIAPLVGKKVDASECDDADEMCTSDSEGGCGVAPDGDEGPEDGDAGDVSGEADVVGAENTVGDDSDDVGANVGATVRICESGVDVVQQVTVIAQDVDVSGVDGAGVGEAQGDVMSTRVHDVSNEEAAVSDNAAATDVAVAAAAADDDDNDNDDGMSARCNVCGNYVPMEELDTHEYVKAPCTPICRTASNAFVSMHPCAPAPPHSTQSSMKCLQSARAKICIWCDALPFGAYRACCCCMLVRCQPSCLLNSHSLKTHTPNVTPGTLAGWVAALQRLAPARCAVHQCHWLSSPTTK